MDASTLPPWRIKQKHFRMGVVRPTGFSVSAAVNGAGNVNPFPPLPQPLALGPVIAKVNPAFALEFSIGINNANGYSTQDLPAGWTNLNLTLADFPQACSKIVPAGPLSVGVTWGGGAGTIFDYYGMLAVFNVKNAILKQTQSGGGTLAGGTNNYALASSVNGGDTGVVCVNIVSNAGCAVGNVRTSAGSKFKQLATFSQFSQAFNTFQQMWLFYCHGMIGTASDHLLIDVTGTPASGSPFFGEWNMF